MDKKTIMKMNDTWKNFRLQEYKIFQPGFQHGFDLSDFKPGGFKKVLKALGIPATADHQGSRGFFWKGRDILIVTGNNPITGKFNNPQNRKPERNYASYIGIEGSEEKVKRAVELIKKYTSYRKGESKGRRDFI